MLLKLADKPKKDYIYVGGAVISSIMFAISITPITILASFLIFLSIMCIMSKNKSVVLMYSVSAVLLTAGYILTGTQLGLVFKIFAYLSMIVAMPFHFWIPRIWGKLDYATVAANNIFSTLVGTTGILKIIMVYPPVEMATIFTGIGFISVVYAAFSAISEQNIKKLIGYFDITQVGLILLDFGIGLMLVEIDTIGVIQFMNYAIAMPLLLLSIGWVVSKGKSENISILNGIAKTAPLLGIFIAISALSFAGVPGLNIFISEWITYMLAMQVGNPFVVAIVAVAVISCFIPFFKVFYTTFVGVSKLKIKISLPTKILGIALTILCIILGLLPRLNLMIAGA